MPNKQNINRVIEEIKADQARFNMETYIGTFDGKNMLGFRYSDQAEENQNSCNTAYCVGGFAARLYKADNDLSWHQIRMLANPSGYVDHASPNTLSDGIAIAARTFLGLEEREAYDLFMGSWTTLTLDEITAEMAIAELERIRDTETVESGTSVP